MPYVGPAPNPGQNREVDDISSGFNGSEVNFTLQVNGQNVSPGSSNNIVVSLGGVVQNPSTDYTVAASTLTFTTAPANGLSFFGLVLGQQVDIQSLAVGTSPTMSAPTITGDLSIADKIVHTGDTNNAIRFPAADTITAETGGSERVRVDSSGRVGIGSNNPQAALHINNSVAEIRLSDADGDGSAYSQIISGLTGNLFIGADVGGAGANTRIAMLVDNSEKLRIDSNGLKFNGDSAAANALSDYEEGTWTPTVSQGFTSVQYETNGRQGSYTKIGRFVFFTLMIHLGGTTATASSGIEITGLPFTAKSFSHDNAAAGGADPFYQDGFYNANDFSAIVADGQTKLQLVRRDTGAALTGTSTNGGREFRMTGTYMT